MIYLDYAANTPVDKAVLQCFTDVSVNYVANANSLHRLGIEAAKLIDSATERICDLLSIIDSDIIYTSGATESNNLAIKGTFDAYAKSGHIITTQLDHPSVIAPIKVLEEKGFEVDFVDVLKNGQVDIEHLKGLLRKDTALVSIPYVDSELGTIQPIDEISKIIKQYPKCVFFTDASQAIGKIKVDFSLADLVSIAPHKFYGLNGIGILVKKKNVVLNAIIHGGKSTTVYRSGSPATALIASTAKALQLILPNIEANFCYVSKMNKMLRDGIAQYKGVYINSPVDASPYILNFSSASDIYDKLEKSEIYISKKSACCPVNTMSQPVYAVTKNKRLAMTPHRVSLSHITTDYEIKRFLNVFTE